MTPSQRRLARHALGLPNKHLVSYRNRFQAPPRNSAHDEWMDMVERGEARALPETRGHGSAMDCFELTTHGAKLALNDGETLDAEDFPQ